MSLDTPEDWWAMLDAHWPNIIDIFSRCGAPLDEICWRDEPGGEEIFHEDTLIVTLEKSKRDRDHEQMIHFLQLCWMAAPDKPYIHEWPSWGHLCDLCSEQWVFDPEEAAQDG